MSEIKEKALAKMLDEMNQQHTPVEDTIHNYLCDQEDDEIYVGILKDGRTIKGAVRYMANKARKMSEGNMAVVDDATGFSWVQDYFKAEKIEESKDLNFNVQTEKPKTKVAANKPAPNKKPATREDNEQMSLFEDLL